MARQHEGFDRAGGTVSLVFHVIITMSGVTGSRFRGL
jgi:hypothetical protein